MVEAARAISGDADPWGILRDCAGIRNKTAERIAKACNAVRELGDVVGPASEVKRAWSVNALAFVLADGSRSGLEKLGCKVGDEHFATVGRFLRSGDLVYAPPGGHAGRSRHPQSKSIQEAWVGLAEESSRATASGQPTMLIRGGLKSAAQKICAAYDASLTTVYALRPPDVVCATKHTDLCIHCEALRRVRLELITVANRDGARINTPSPHAGQGVVSSPGNQAAQHCSTLQGPSEEVEQLLSDHATLKWHEDQNASLRAKYKKALACETVVTFDYASNLVLKSDRGDSAEFRNPFSATHFGAMFSSPAENGGRSTCYVDVFCESARHTSRVAVAALTKAVSLAVAEKGFSFEGKNVLLFCDNATHFACGELAYGVLFGVLPRARSVSLTYHARYHGKTPLDAHFARVKSAVGLIPREKWSPGAPDFRSAITGAVNTLRNTRVAFLDEIELQQGDRKKLNIRHISYVHELMADFATNTSGVLYVEGAPVQVAHTTVVQGEDKDDRATKSTRAQSGCMTDVANACRLLRKQRRALEQVQKRRGKAGPSRE